MDMEIKEKNSKKLKNGGKRIDCNGWMMFKSDCKVDLEVGLGNWIEKYILLRVYFIFVVKFHFTIDNGIRIETRNFVDR